jgi:hypothetical protein
VHGGIHRITRSEKSKKKRRITMDWDTIIKQATFVHNNIIEEKRRRAKLHDEHVVSVAQQVADDMRRQLGFSLDEGKFWADGETAHNYTDILTGSVEDVVKQLRKRLPMQVYGKIYKADPLRVTWYVQVNPEMGVDEDEDSYF